MTFGLCSMIAPLRRVALRKPGPSLIGADPKVWHYGPAFDPGRVARDHAAFAEILTEAGVDIDWMAEPDAGIADAVFTYDASLMTPGGAVLMSPGKRLRQGEQDLHRAFYQSAGIPILGQITGAARAEAGDTLWLDDRTLVIGRGFRTNPDGAEQLQAIMKKMKIDVHVFDLPVYLGADACLHLMSLISLVDVNKALICTRLLPVGLYELLQRKGFVLIDAPFDEFVASGTLSTNVLALSPGECVMLDGLPETHAALRAAGVSLRLFQGHALCVGCEGGPTCLTRPLLRG